MNLPAAIFDSKMDKEMLELLVKMKFRKKKKKFRFYGRFHILLI